MAAKRNLLNGTEHIMGAEQTAGDGLSVADDRTRIIVVAGTLGTTAVVLAAHPTIERLWNRASLC